MQGAIEADKKQEYDEAYKLYSNALDYFMLALKCASLVPLARRMLTRGRAPRAVQTRRTSGRRS